MKKIIVATRNKHKFSEIKAFLEKHDVKADLTSLHDHPELPDIDEDCLSFEGNSLKKAKVIAVATQQIVLADDSGLVVEALNGRPGVFSARYAGKGATDEKNNLKLLEEIKQLPKDKRKAKFVCSMVMYFPNGTFYTSLGELNGQMIEDFRGEHGFGYDPMFYMPHKNCTLAQIPELEKIKFSHRTRALEGLMKFKDLF